LPNMKTVPHCWIFGPRNNNYERYSLQGCNTLYSPVQIRRRFGSLYLLLVRCLALSSTLKMYIERLPRLQCRHIAKTLLFMILHCWSMLRMETPLPPKIHLCNTTDSLRFNEKAKLSLTALCLLQQSHCPRTCYRVTTHRCIETKLNSWMILLPHFKSQFHALTLLA
jgi:hypothetical protein